MTTRGPRYFVAAALSIAVALTSPAATLAGPSSHTTTSQVDLGCDLLESNGASTYLFAAAGDDVSFADVQVWIEPASPIFDPPTLVTGSSVATVADDGEMFLATIDLLTGDGGAPVGAAVVQASVANVGAAEVIERSASGNHKERVTETIQPMLVSGTLTVPGGFVFELDACSASDRMLETFTNDPTSTVRATTFIGLLCEWSTDAGYVVLHGQSDKALSYLDIGIATGESGFEGTNDQATLTRSHIAASWDLRPTGGQGISQSGGTATATARVARGERFATAESTDGTKLRTVIEEFIVDGSLTISWHDGTVVVLRMDTASCTMTEYSERFIAGGD